MTDYYASSDKPLSGSPIKESEEVPETNSQAEQTVRLAELVAHGEIAIPTNLPEDQMHHFAQLVREHRRKRLLQFISRAIAQDIIRSRDTN